MVRTCRRTAAAADRLLRRPRADGVRRRPDSRTPAGGIPLSQQAVLFRASHHSIGLEAELARHDLPFAKYGGLKFVEAAHVKDLLSLIRLAENPRDIVSGRRALCLLPGIGPKKAGDLLGELQSAAGPFDAWQEAAVPAKSKETWPAFVKLLRSLAGDGHGRGLGTPDSPRDQVLRADSAGAVRQHGAASGGPRTARTTGRQLPRPRRDAGRSGHRSAQQHRGPPAGRAAGGPPGAEHDALGQGPGMARGLRVARHRGQDAARSTACGIRTSWRRNAACSTWR